MYSVKEFVVNQFITLRLVSDKTEIYVLGERFRQCKFLLINIPIDKITTISEITSIDEASENLDKTLESYITKSPLTPEMEFWGHCSNMQTWFENNYNTVLLHRNLAFPLLQKLTKVGDPIAKKVFKEEVAKRFESGHKTVIKFLIKEGYVDYLSNDEMESIQPKKIKFLYLSGLKLKIIPKWVSKFQFLEELDVADNLLVDLPEWIGELSQLKKLDLSYNFLEKTPDTFLNLRRLEELNLKYNNFHKLPDWIGQLKKLKKISLGYNPFESIPHSWQNLIHLEILDLRDSNLKELPKWFGTLAELKEINLENTLIDHLPSSMKNLARLELLILEGVKFLRVDQISNFINEKSLTALNLCKTGFSEIINLKKFNQLEILGLAGNNIKHISNLKHLRNLRVLNISGNDYSKIEGLENLTDLEDLDMDLIEIDGLQNLSKLKHLTINYTDEVKPLLDKLVEIWQEKERAGYEVHKPQKVVEYCRKKRYSIEEFEREFKEGGLSKVSLVVLEELSKGSNKKADKLLKLSQIS